MARRRSSRSPVPTWLSRTLFGALLLFTLYFALQGGEYGTTDLFEQRARKAGFRTAIDSLERQVDSLEALAEALRTDRRLQERIAREEFGMIREGELLYRFTEPEPEAEPHDPSDAR